MCSFLNFCVQLYISLHSEEVPIIKTHFWLFFNILDGALFYDKYANATEMSFSVAFL